jgi:hypothetical protein
VCVVSTIRLANIPSSVIDPDFTWVAALGYVLMYVYLVLCRLSLLADFHRIVEMYTGIICACLPSLKTIIKHHFPGFLEFNPQLSTVPAFPTDDLQFSGQTQQNAFVSPFDQSQTGSESGKTRSSVQLQTIDSIAGSNTGPEGGVQHSAEANTGLEQPPRAMLAGETANGIP